jgi:hypothetical protein
MNYFGEKTSKAIDLLDFGKLELDELSTQKVKIYLTSLSDLDDSKVIFQEEG